MATKTLPRDTSTGKFVTEEVAEKQRALAEEAAKKAAVLAVATNALTVATAPAEALVSERDQIIESLRLTKWGGLVSAVPRGQRDILQTRLRTVTRELHGIERIKHAKELYDPFIPNPAWVLGLADLNDAKRDSIGHWESVGSGAITASLNRRYYNAPMPAQAISAWAKAKSTGLFDLFVVSSPDANQFATSRVRPLWTADPILIGLIASDRGASIEGYTGQVDSLRRGSGTMGGCVGFLIAQWDLQHDLAHVVND
jgi:hypothetical protein